MRSDFSLTDAEPRLQRCYLHAEEARVTRAGLVSRSVRLQPTILGLIRSISGYYTSYRAGKSHRCVTKSMFFVRSLQHVQTVHGGH